MEMAAFSARQWSTRRWVAGMVDINGAPGHDLTEGN